jgi:hypothetical protein
MEKNCFVFYRDWADVLYELSDKERLQAFDAILAFAFRDETPTDKTIRIATSLMRSQIVRDNEKWEKTRTSRSIAGKKGMESRYNKTQQNLTNVTKSTKEVEVNVEEEVNVEVAVEEEVKGKKRKAIAYPYDEVVSLWNEICSPLPQVKRLNDSRRNKIKCRLVEFSKNSEEWLPKTRELFERVIASDFLRGEKADWQATFDWLFDNSKNWVKVVEGNYDNERKRTTQQPEVRLGVGEFLDEKGERRYGSGNLPPVPMDAPPRPDNDSIWSRESNSWIPTGV